MWPIDALMCESVFAEVALSFLKMIICGAELELDLSLHPIYTAIAEGKEDQHNQPWPPLCMMIIAAWKRVLPY